MYFKIISKIKQIENIAVKSSIRELKGLEKLYGRGRWRKVKGIALVRLADNTIHNAELHWYQAHGIGKKLLKIKKLLD